MYALIQNGYTVFGTGSTVEDARKDAAQWLEGGEEAAAEAKSFSSMSAMRMSSTDGDLVIVPCTEALAAHVQEFGGDVTWGELNGALCLESEEVA